MWNILGWRLNNNPRPVDLFLSAVRPFLPTVFPAWMDSLQGNIRELFVLAQQLTGKHQRQHGQLRPFASFLSSGLSASPSLGGINNISSRRAVAANCPAGSSSNTRPCTKSFILFSSNWRWAKPMGAQTGERLQQGAVPQSAQRDGRPVPLRHPLLVGHDRLLLFLVFFSPLLY